MRHWSVIWLTVFCFHLFCCCCSLLFIMSISSVVIVSVDVMQCASLFPLIPVRALRSVDQNLLMATHTQFHTRGDWSFQAVAPSSLEPSSTLFDTFKCKLKTHLFVQVSNELLLGWYDCVLYYVWCILSVMKHFCLWKVLWK